MAVVVLKTKVLAAVLLVFLLPGLSAAAAQPGGGVFERTLGADAAPALMKEYGGEYILPIQERLWVEEIFQRLVAVTERTDLEYSLTVLNSHELNAFALPGGYVFITRGMLNFLGRDEAKLAAVLAHEIAHVERKHGVSAVLRQMGLTVLAELGVMALDFASADLLRLASVTLVQLLQLGWGREAEYEADALGQILAAKAGFDPAGAIGVLDALADLESDELPLKVFRTHPDSLRRRDRLAESLAAFWSQPAPLSPEEVAERLNGGRNSDQTGRSDPKGRYVVEVPAEANLGLELWDSQTEQVLTWAPQAVVRDYAWSPQGQHLAVLVEGELGDELWVFDRWGILQRKIKPEPGPSTIIAFSWSPQGQLLALDLEQEGEGGSQVAVAYLHLEVQLVVGRGLGARGSRWLGDGLAYEEGGQWYLTLPPQVKPVVIANPVPQVLQRKRIVEPTLLKEGNTFRLTRPAFTLP